MIFQSELTNIDSEITALLAQVEAAKQRQSQLIELDALTDDTLEKLGDVVGKIGYYAPDAITHLKSAVLGLFDGGDNGTDDGNQPIDPTPEGDDDGEPELIAFNGITGDCLTTPDLEDGSTSPSTPEDNENKCIRGADMPQPKDSPTEMVHLSANCGYLKLKADDRVLAAYAWFSRKNIAEAWASHVETIPSAKVMMRESKRNTSWKWELKVTGLSMSQIERLSKEALHAKPPKESPAQLAGIEPPSDWGKVQPQESKLPPCPFVEGDIVDWKGCKLRVAHIGVEKLYCTFAHEPERTKHHTTVAIADCTPVQSVEPDELQEGDTCEVLRGRYAGQTGVVASFNCYSEYQVSLDLGQHVKHFVRSDVKFLSKAQPKRKQPQPGRLLLGNRLVTNGNFIGVAHRGAILNSRNNVAEKIATIQIMKDLQANGLDPQLALVAEDDASDF